MALTDPKGLMAIGMAGLTLGPKGLMAIGKARDTSLATVGKTCNGLVEEAEVATIFGGVVTRFIDAEEFMVAALRRFDVYISMFVFFLIVISREGFDFGC